MTFVALFCKLHHLLHLCFAFAFGRIHLPNYNIGHIISGGN